jgi:outer membrane protein OmpA-like peptidoglycan-associated protein
MHPTTEPAPAADVLDRDDLPRGILNTAWPIAALALLLLMLLRACVPVMSGTTQPFDPAAATRHANDMALDALRALPAEPELDPAVNALNAVVINFTSGSDVVPAEVGELLDAAAKVIAALPEGTRIVITGHTDNVGDPTANLALSQRRAASVRSALLLRGAPADMLAAQGVGGSRPVADNSTEAGRFRNRRIEFGAAP